jgi:transposase
MSKLAELDPLAAGIDVGSEQMFVSIAGDTPEVYGATTTQLQKLRNWLLSHRVKSVAVEATGIYWLCLYEVLEEAGIKVLVVNGRHVRNLPGRKTDMKDCQWLATMHSHGLLRSGFVPPAHIRRLQDYVRLRQDHIALAASHVQHMQKALERMNVKLHDVIRYLTGVSGLRVIRAILAGERDPALLIRLCDEQIRGKKADRLAEALHGTWREEHLFALRQALEAWEFYQKQILECDHAIEAVLRESSETGGSSPGTTETGESMAQNVSLSTAFEQERDIETAQQCEAGHESLTDGKTPQIKAAVKAKKRGPNTPKIAELHEMLVRICGGKDATAIPGIADHTLLQLIAEVGTDLSAWPSAKHFTSWMGTSPGSNQSGKRRGSVRRQMNRVGRMFCMIAMSVGRSTDKGLGGFYRRLKSRRGAQVANKALARKLATLYWQCMTHGLEFVEQGLAQYQVRAAETQLRVLKKLAGEQGLILLPKDFLHTGVIG